MRSVVCAPSPQARWGWVCTVTLPLLSPSHFKDNLTLQLLRHRPRGISAPLLPPSRRPQRRFLDPPAANLRGLLRLQRQPQRLLLQLPLRNSRRAARLSHQHQQPLVRRQLLPRHRQRTIKLRPPLLNRPHQLPRPHWRRRRLVRRRRWRPQRNRMSAAGSARL